MTTKRFEQERAIRLAATPMEERAVRLLDRTWMAIGYDILASYGNAERVSLKGREVQEHVTCCGILGGWPEEYGDDIEACRWLDAQSEAKQRKILDRAFPRSHKFGA